MNKEAFLTALREGLAKLPQVDAEERLAFYGEMIDDRIEEGLGEDEAVASVGSIDEIVAQTATEIPVVQRIKEKIAPKRKLRAWEIVLIVLGFPVWFSLLAVAGALLLALYIVLWALVLSLWASAIALAVCVPACIVLSVAYFAKGLLEAGLMILGSALICAGLAILLCLGCIGATKGALKLTLHIARGVKSAFTKKEDVK
ncbi:MAG: DUF1700 domain-containing protein [Clostridia bacterium]|nr:DUF1700 domain-containing protein [Clostridia bacterium]